MIKVLKSVIYWRLLTLQLIKKNCLIGLELLSTEILKQMNLSYTYVSLAMLIYFQKVLQFGTMHRMEYFV